MTQDGCARAVAEEDARVAVGPVHRSAYFVRADDEYGVAGAAGDELLGDFHPVQEAGAGGGEVKADGALVAEDFLD